MTFFHDIILVYVLLMKSVYLHHFLLSCCVFCLMVYSYEEALQTLADSEAKRETVDKELRLVSTKQQ